MQKKNGEDEVEARVRVKVHESGDNKVRACETW